MTGFWTFGNRDGGFGGYQEVEASWQKVVTKAQELSATLTRESTKQVRPEVKTALRDMIATMNELSSYDNSIGLAKLKTTVKELNGQLTAACTA
ncbi:hypothetical protein GCM10010399_71610 [Dactylosporangium fulvum]|uniref:Uncharacterized protein n=1 Tax=Dactylosporangium fulvum TaxID=53359 RepID=A0ABY5VY14_9ACTN|nr:hypothetical protein [Dactylosporangium fulvum]UWP82167.1 hypothetical protein Dfulv_45075 [Dactylosporangium fulvum]